MHCYKAFSLIKQAKNNIFVHLRPTEYKEVRKAMISAILSTDMTVHFELTSKFDTHVSAKLHEGTEELFTKDIKDRQLLLNVILHSADISNMVRPPMISRKWSDLVFEEFLSQGDLEKKHGLPISPFMNRDDTNQAKMSLNFIDYVVSPLFNGIAKAFSELKHFTQNLAVNREFWSKEKEKT